MLTLTLHITKKEEKETVVLESAVYASLHFSVNKHDTKPLF